MSRASSERGFAIDVANFEDLIINCESFGPRFNPARADLKIPALRISLDSSVTALTSWNNAKTLLGTAIAKRDLLFDPFKKMSTKIMGHLRSLDVPDDIIEDAEAINDLIQGRSSTTKNKAKNKEQNADGPEPSGSSSAKTSHTRVLDHFSRLIQLLEAIPQYGPNELELGIPGLRAYYNDMKAKNTNVTQAESALKNAGFDRDRSLNQKKTGVLVLAPAVKEYIKSAFGATSPQFKQVAKIPFSTAAPMD